MELLPQAQAAKERQERTLATPKKARVTRPRGNNSKACSTRSARSRAARSRAPCSRRVTPGSGCSRSWSEQNGWSRPWSCCPRPKLPRSGPAQQVMTHCNQKHYRGDLGQSPDGEPRHPVLAHLSISPFGGGASLPVHGLGLLCGHALAPLDYLGTIAVAGTGQGHLGNASGSSGS